MAFDSLRDFLGSLERMGELKHIKAEVDPVHELGAIAYHSLLKKGPALLFDNVKGHKTPLVTNVLSTDRKVAVALGIEGDMQSMFEKFLSGFKNPIAPIEVKAGPCKEEIYQDDAVDITKFPTPVWHEKDAGPYLGTFHGCITRDRATGDQNMGMYRLLVKDRKTLWMSIHRDGLAHYRKYEEANEPMPMAVAIGMEPLLCIASMSPISSGLARHAEFAYVGGLRGKPVELTKCETLDLLVPAQAEIVLEGAVLPKVRVDEGPHGESHGFYGGEKQGLVFEVKCVTHRRNPIHQGLICNFMEDGGKRITRSAVLWGKLKSLGTPGVVDVRFPDPGCGREICVVSADIKEPGQVMQIIETVWGVNAMGPNWIIVVDADADLDDWNDIWWRMYSRTEPHRDVWITPPRQHGGHQPLVKHGFTSRIAIDATSKFKGVEFPEVNTVSKELTQKVLSRWAELGLE
jgi:4-hydroxy-3-polyprenylbenzoate decarboxylase